MPQGLEATCQASHSLLKGQYQMRVDWSDSMSFADQALERFPGQSSVNLSASPCMKCKYTRYCLCESTEHIFCLSFPGGMETGPATELAGFPCKMKR